MNRKGATIRVAVFFAVGALAASLLYTALSDTRLGVDTRSYSAVFHDVSALESGNEVRVAGVRVGQVSGIQMRSENTIEVSFTVQSDQPVTRATHATVRYSDLIGNRYLELRKGDDGAKRLPVGGTIRKAQTSPALDLDILLGGFKPLFRGLQPKQINKLASDIVATLQGKRGTVDSLLTHTASLTNTLADRDKVIGQLIDNLNQVLDTLSNHDDQVSQLVSNLQKLVSGLSEDRGKIGSALEEVDKLTSDVAGLLRETRRPLKNTLDSVHRLAATLDENKSTLEKTLDNLPAAYKRLHRAASFGAFFNMYLCSIQLKVTGADGKPVLFPVLGSNTNTPRCNP